MVTWVRTAYGRMGVYYYNYNVFILFSRSLSCIPSRGVDSTPRLPSRFHVVGTSADQFGWGKLIRDCVPEVVPVYMQECFCLPSFFKLEALCGGVSILAERRWGDIFNAWCRGRKKTTASCSILLSFFKSCIEDRVVFKLLWCLNVEIIITPCHFISPSSCFT